jgi:catechol 2,3-dioxygenase
MNLIHPHAYIGRVHYTVADLRRQIAFYQEILGFRLHWREGESAGLGAGGNDLLRLTERPDARRVMGTTGLYHTAFLVPTRWELAHLLKRIAETRTPIDGMTNHGTHLAIYLPDAEGNGIELAWDFPRDQWPDSFAQMRRLDAQELFGALADRPANWTGLSSESGVGHIHLHVADLEPTKQFYGDILGFGVPFTLSDMPGQWAETAAFFAAGDYHHHIGTNTWQGVGAPSPPPEALGLRYFTVALPDEEALDWVNGRLQSANIPLQRTETDILTSDPSQNQIQFTLIK